MANVKTYKMEPETSEKLQKICEELNLTWDGTFQTLANLYMQQKAIGALPERGMEVKEFQSLLNRVSEAFTYALTVNADAEERIRQEFAKKFASQQQDLAAEKTRADLAAKAAKEAELRAKEQEGQAKTLREQMENDLDAMAAMIDATLDYLRGLQENEAPRLIDINALLEQMAEAMNLHEDLLTIEGHCKWPYRGKLLALKRCIGNLVDNGIKYGHRVRVILMDDEEMLILFIMDEGPGLPEDQFERIFEPYYRLSTDSAGTGLGLGIARNIAHAHGGDLVLENRPQGGLQATLSLPRQ